MIESRPRFLQGIFPFAGAGFDRPVTLARHVVPSDRRAQPIYLRAGNSSDELVTLSLLRDGALMRLFPLGARAAEHVALALVEDIEPDSALEIAVAAPAGVAGIVVLDFGLVEI